MEQFASVRYSDYYSRSTFPKKPKMEPKQEKYEIVPKDFDSTYSAVNARIEMSNKKHLID